jgi:acetyltransferase
MAAMSGLGGLLRLENRKVRRMAADRDTAGRIIKKKLGKSDRYFMAEREANEILQCYGFPVLKSRLVKDIDQLEDLFEEVGPPMAMKISSPDIIHKFDAGGVRLKVKTLDQAKQTFQEIMANARNFDSSARIEGILMESMARGGVEVILGATRDQKFGPMCMFGLGGTFVEAMQDVTFRLSPMWEVSAEIMISSIKAYRVLKGIRGNPPSDIEAIKDCILRLSQMIDDHQEISELDINPLIVYPEGEGCVVADSRILLAV